MNDIAELFGWLSVLFARAPSVEAIAAHRRGPAAAWMDALSADPALAPGLARMRRILDLDADDAEIATQLGRRYLLMFEGAGGPNTVPPYESVFTPGAEWRLFQAPTAEMEALLAESDLSVSDDVALPADHLAIELALAAHLAAEGDARAAAMVGRLAGWVPGFASACAAADEEGFWAGAAEVLAAALEPRLGALNVPDALDRPKRETEEARA